MSNQLGGRGRSTYGTVFPFVALFMEKTSVRDQIEPNWRMLPTLLLGLYPQYGTLPIGVSCELYYWGCSPNMEYYHDSLVVTLFGVALLLPGTINGILPQSSLTILLLSNSFIGSFLGSAFLGLGRLGGLFVEKGEWLGDFEVFYQCIILLVSFGGGRGFKLLVHKLPHSLKPLAGFHHKLLFEIILEHYHVLRGAIHIWISGNLQECLLACNGAVVQMSMDTEPMS